MLDFNNVGAEALTGCGNCGPVAVPLLDLHLVVADAANESHVEFWCASCRTVQRFGVAEASVGALIRVGVIFSVPASKAPVVPAVRPVPRGTSIVGRGDSSSVDAAVESFAAALAEEDFLAPFAL